MFDGSTRRVVSLWFPRLASDRILRARPVSGPFAITLRQSNSDRLHCLNHAAERMGLSRGMSLADARVFCPDLITRPAELSRDLRFLSTLRRWATRYCPWVGHEGKDGLVLDVTGATHLMGGEMAMLSDMRMRLVRAGISVRIGLADTRGAAFALAHFGEGVAHAGQMLDGIGELPVAALRLPDATVVGLERLGLRKIRDLAASPRAPLTRRFGPEVLLRLDQALGHHPEQISPEAEPPHYGVRMTMPDPIGLTDDVMAATERLLRQLCDKLKAQEMGARVLALTLRRVDQGSQQVELRLASAMRDAGRILPLFARGVAEVDAGFGIDQMRLEAVRVEPLPVQQIGQRSSDRKEALDDLITRIGNRIGLENILRFLPADSHIPERGFITAPAAYSRPEPFPALARPRPLRMFPPELVHAPAERTPPRHFRWRRMPLRTLHAIGPERIAPEWWMADEAWSTGIRDYWRIETSQGRRLWMFHTPQNPGWFVQGEFP